MTKDGLQTEYPIDGETYKIEVPNKVGGHSFFADITWDNQEKETVFFDITVMTKSFDKISAYLKEKSINTFSLYYELLEFKISDYQEEVVNGNVEAIFSYTIVHKNYDRAPDTVQYIKNESLKMNVFFDINTGEVFSATEQTGYDEDGRSMWKEIDVNNL